MNTKHTTKGISFAEKNEESFILFGTEPTGVLLLPYRDNNPDVKTGAFLKMLLNVQVR